MKFGFADLVPVFNWTGKIKTHFTKQKITTNFKLDVEGVKTVLNMMKLEAVGGFIIKNDDDLKKMKANCEKFAKTYDIIMDYKATGEVEQAKNAKITIKKLMKLADAQKGKDPATMNEGEKQMKIRIDKAIEWQKDFKEI